MFVRQLIGRQAGEIIEMRADAAQACLAQGSAAPVTDEEMAAAGMAKPQPEDDVAPGLPDGYEALRRSDGLGFDVYRAPVLRSDDNVITSDSLNVAPLPNMIAVRDFVAENGGTAPGGAPADSGNVAIPEDWQSLDAAGMKSLAGALGAVPAPSTKAAAVAFIEAVIAGRAAAAAEAADAAAAAAAAAQTQA